MVGEISDARVTEVDIEPEDVLVIEAKEECVLLEDFTGDSVLRWGTVNDGVMGGRSDGTARVVDGVLTHTGTINTNGGGFSYVGARLPSDTLTSYSGIQIRLNTYGREYAINFNDKRYWRVSHQVPVPVTGTNTWQEVFIDFDDTVPTVFSRPIDSEPFLGSAIDEMNFILSDGIDGPFRGEIDWIKLCV